MQVWIRILLDELLVANMTCNCNGNFFEQLWTYFEFSGGLKSLNRNDILSKTQHFTFNTKCYPRK